MNVQELDTVTLLEDHPEYGLSIGDVGAVVYAPIGAMSAEVEFLAWDGNTVAVATIPLTHLRRLEPQDMMHSRPRPVAPQT